MFKTHTVTGYSISDTGQVKKKKGKGYKVLAISDSGYKILSTDNKTYYVHRLVWETYNGEIPEGMWINHINGVKTDNSLDNLELVTPKENYRHAMAMGLVNPSRPGETNAMSKLSNEEYLSIIALIMEGKSNQEIGDCFDLHPRYISLIRGKKRLKTLWTEYENIHGEKEIPMSGDQCKLSLSERLLLLEELSFRTNKELAEKYDLDLSSLSRIRNRRAWNRVWKIFEQKCNDYSVQEVGSSDSKRGAS